MAPEIMRGKYDDKVDMWSAGVLLYEILSDGNYVIKNTYIYFIIIK